jgi:hypothetical protein
MADMKKGFYFFLMFTLSVPLVCCSKDKAEKPKVLAMINDYSLTLDDFESQLTEELELDQDFKLTQEAKHEFLEGLIRKQVLIQEAKKMQLDRKEDFVRSIQRYWESTLIRNLIEIKSSEIDKRIYVSQEEVQARYEQLGKSESVSPLSEVQDTLQEEIKEEKKTKKLEQWVDDLKRKASVKIDETLL